MESAAENGVLREYTAWAVSLGEVDAWKRAFKQSSRLNYDGDLASDDYLSDDYLFASYAFNSSYDVRTTQYSPSSYDSGWSGDFGGGFDGGGGGGGGGGSW